MSRDRLNSRRNQIRRQKTLRSKCVSGKKRYRTEEQAQTALDRIQHADNSARVKVPQRVYSCPHCAGWHVTSQRIPLVSRTPIPRRSKKTAATYRKLRVPLVVEMLEAYPWCERCKTGRASEVHELLSRARGGRITDPSNCVTLCHECHSWITTHPAQATADGWLRHSWETL